MGSAKSRTVFFGGHSAFHVKEGNTIASGLSSDEVRDLVGRLLVYCRTTGKTKERTCRFVERIGTGWLNG